MSTYKDYPAAYENRFGSVLEVDKAFYRRLASAVEQRKKIDEFAVPLRSGRAWEVPSGHIFRITTTEGPQVGDLNLWSLQDRAERLWTARTRQLQGAHVSTFDRLWSNLPFLRPMATIIGDSLSDYGVDEHGGRIHDLLGTRCDPYVNKLLTGHDFDHHCHSNLVRAIQPFGLEESDVHDVLNVFQVTGLNHEDKYFMKPSPAAAGDYLEFFAEIDLLCAMSTCPGGDLSIPLWGSDVDDALAVCRPLGVEVFAVECDLLKGWSEPSRASYDGHHGLARPANQA